MAVISSRLFPLLKPMASRPFTSRSLLKKPTPSFKDCSLTMDLYQNFGLFPTSHSVLLTRTRKSVVLKNLLQDLCGTLRELVFWASQHFSHRKLGDESLHFLKDPRCYQSSPLSRALAIYLRLFAILA